jgi:hypothetical protein
LALLKRSPVTYNFAHRFIYGVRKKRGQVRDLLPLEEFVIRLLVLKTWGDVFLSYPVLQTN